MHISVEITGFKTTNEKLTLVNVKVLKINTNSNKYSLKNEDKLTAISEVIFPKSLSRFFSSFHDMVKGQLC